MPREKKNTASARGRGRGRGSSRGRSRGLGQRHEDEPLPSVPRIFEEDLNITCANIQKTKKALSKMPVDERKEYAQRKRQKELERILLPDAPPRKRARKTSPPRVPCRLVIGTPNTPPPPKPQHWQYQLSTFDERSSIVSTSSSLIPTLTCDWTTGDLGDSPLATPLPCRRISATITSADVPDEMSSEICQGTDITSDKETSTHNKEPQPSTSQQQGSILSTALIADLQTDKGEELVTEWLEQISNDENDDFEPDLGPQSAEQDFANEAPAHLPDDIDNTFQDWFTRQDNDADRVIRDLIPPDNLTFDWTNNADAFQGHREEFCGQFGPTFSVPEDARPIDIFLKFFSDEIFETLVSETNRRISNILRPVRQHSRFQRVKETSREEIAVFIAVLIFQGLMPLTVEKDYWRYNGYLTLAYFKQLMSYNRFLLLKRLLHFTDNEAPTDSVDDAKLRKLGPLLNLFNSKFSELYLPSRDIAIDESLLKWHGRLSFAQKIATKAAKVGVETYELCESSTGYLWKFFIYTGKDQSHGRYLDQETDRHDEETILQEEQAPSSATAQIVLDLVKPLLNRGHTLTMDNFYNSPLLARYLKKKGTDCLGTLRVNRQFVPESIKGMSKNELRPGEIVQSYCQDLSILLWRDKNVIAMLSTFHGGEIGGKEKNGTYRYKPQAVLDYNISMGGVDKKDQLLSSHPIERGRNQAWYKKVFRRLLNVTILNSYIIYKTRFPKVNQREFRFRLANELVETFKNLPPFVPPPTSDVEVVRIIKSKKRERPILRGNHFIGEGKSRYLKCVWCKNSRTKYVCKQCNVSLCLLTCFEQYHS